jgi:glutamate synthase domain-containing protein 2
MLRSLDRFPQGDHVTPADNDHAVQPSQPSGTYTPAVIEDIQTKAELGRYRIRGFGTLRPRTWATFDDLTILPCGLTRIPLEGYREQCSTRTVLGTRFAAKPVELDIPFMVTGMSYGALSYNAKVALARGARAAHLRGPAEQVRHQRPSPAPGGRH